MYRTFAFFHQSLHIQTLCILMTTQFLKILHSKVNFNYSQKQLPQNILSSIHALKYPSQMVFRPSHSINPP